ncbi:MAG: hypothetical protein H0T51_19370 [Pirellulales bacterium]|nr:hypothetical protein [Pirellulales bacterium]
MNRTHGNAGLSQGWAAVGIWRNCRWLALAAVLLLAAGCSGKPTKGDVAGTVTIDGVPAEAGAIAFSPVDGQSATAGGSIEKGRYAAQVPPGKMMVEIRVAKVVGQRKLYDTPDSPMAPIMEEVLPAKYNDATKLVVEVQLGENEHNFELTTK